MSTDAVDSVTCADRASRHMDIAPVLIRARLRASRRFQGRRTADDGTVMMLVIGLIPILAGMIAVGTDAAVLFTHRRALVAQADAAVLAAAQSADLEALYTSRRVESLPLDCVAARSVAARRVASGSTDPRTEQIQLVDFRCTRTSVTLRVRSNVTLPFAHHFGIEPSVEVATNAAATSPLR